MSARANGRQAEIIIARQGVKQSADWDIDGVFVDYLTVRQNNNGSYPDLNDGRVVRIDADGNIVYDTALTMPVVGSYDSKIYLRVTSEFLEIKGNPSRYDRDNNVLGYRLEDCIKVFNRVLAKFNLPPLTESSARRINRKRIMPDSGISGITEEIGYYLTRVDLTLNLNTGSAGNCAAYRRALARQTMPRKKTIPYANGVTYKSRRCSVTVYDKANEIRKHGLHGNRESIANYCDDVGIARVEVRLNWEYLKINNLRSGSTHEKLVEVFIKETENLMKTAEEEVEVEELTVAQLGLLYAWKSGRETRDMVHRNTWYPHRKKIKEVTGYDIGAEPPLKFKPRRKTIVPVPMRRDDFPAELQPPELEK